MKHTGILYRIARSRMVQRFSFTLALILFFEMGLPTFSWALTSGPGQPEYSSFEPASTTDMVNLYDGSFTYNIPLLTVPGPNGGYPINLAYHANPGMEEEAGWVGLGWALNVGAINRQMQGIPDDFDGDEIDYEYHMKDNWGFTLGTTIKGKAHTEVAGVPFAPPSLSGAATPNAWNTQVYFNNYKGLGYRVSSNLIPNEIQGKSTIAGKFSALNLSIDSQNGIGISGNLSVPSAFSVGIGASYHNRTGLNAVSFSATYNLSRVISAVLAKTARNQVYKGGKDWLKKTQAIYDIRSELKNCSGPSISSALSYNFSGQLPHIGLPMKDNQWSFNIRLLGSAGSFRPQLPDPLPTPVPSATPMPLAFQAFPFGHNNNPYPVPSLWYLDFSNASLQNTSESKGATGYLYHVPGNNQVQDFTKQQLEFNKKMPNLGASKQTYDLFTFSGQGTGGFFRAYSNSIDVLAEPEKTTTTSNKDVTVEVGVTGSAVHVGGGYESSNGTNTSGGWQTGSAALGDITSGRYEANQKVFRLHGETSPVLEEDEFLDNWAGDEAVKNRLDDNGEYFGKEYQATTGYGMSDAGGTVTINSSINQKRAQRDKRNTSVKYVDATTAKEFGYTQNYTYYDQATSADVGKFDDEDAYRGNHISEVVVTQTDGARYIYGMPVYNREHVEVSQSCANQAYDPNNPYGNIGSNSYLTGTTHQYNEEMLNKTIYPKYAYSWLLSGIVGTDYIDDDGEPGISKNDKGYWVKFSYAKSHSEYKWRVPYTGANIIERRNGVIRDNMGTFSYGKKEIFYLDKVETATHVAVFETGCRRDGVGAQEAYAIAAGDQQQRYLKKITLYTRPDYEAHEEDLSGASPIMSANFRYDYHLCQGVPNHLDTGCDTEDVYDEVGNPGGHIIEGATGKLTLREVYFTYEKSTKAALSPYKFYYSPSGDIAPAGEYNPDYDINNTDRWGTHKHQDDYGTNYEFGRFPYTEQQTDGHEPADDFAHVAKWSLHRVKLPTGGVVNVSYEPHDYAYEEAKNPMHMYDIVGIGNALGSENEILTGVWYDLDGTNTPVIAAAPAAAPDRFLDSGDPLLADLDDETDNAFRLYFRLDKEYPSGMLEADRNLTILQHYLNYMGKIWFKNKTLISGIDNDGEARGQFEYVEGYATVDLSDVDAEHFGMCKDVGAGSGDPYTIGFITLKKLPIRENGTGIVKGNEMQKLALQIMKLERDDVGNGAGGVGPASGSGTLGAALGFLSSTIGFVVSDLPAIILSYNVAKKALQHCKFIELNGNSKIKLYDEDQRKFGGGYRVREVRLNDQWKNSPSSGVANIEASEYGQRYVYTMDGTRTGMSSGVCYEPAHGKEESALRYPAEYEKSTFLGYHNKMFVEKPILDFYYPGASIGYRKVTTYSLSRDIAAEQIEETSSSAAGINYNATAPVTVTEFYTAKEFPITVDETNIDVASPFIIPISVPGIYSYLEAKKAASQGYAITLNDMAGKLKRTSQYRWLAPDITHPEGALGSLISSSEYLYKTDGTYNENGGNKLDNSVTLALNDSQYGEGFMGIYYDMFVENNESRFEEEGMGVQANVDFLPFPFAPTAFPSESITEMSQKTLVTHKIIYRSGILQKVVAKTDQSVVTTENILFDLETGAPVLTKTNNNFDDAVYTLQHPAHWHYKNTGPMYKNDYLVITGGISTGTGGWYTIGSLSGLPDAYRNLGNLSEGDVVLIDNGTSKSMATIAAIDPALNAINLIRSNGNPVSGTVNSIEMLQSGRRNMLNTNVGAVSFLELEMGSGNYEPKKILDASAIELSEDWQVDCCSDRLGESQTVFNPFATGGRNMWRVKASYGYNVERLYANNSRTDGVFANFDMFNWNNPAGDPNWVKAGEVTKYSPHGFEAETKDALGNFSSARYGYGNILPVALASNSHYADMDFEGFEYFTASDCIENKELFNGNYTSYLVPVAHTGKYGIKVEATPFVFSIPTDTGYACEDGVSNHYQPQIGVLGPLGFDYEDDCNCFGKSYLVEGETYVFSGWVKETGWVNKPTSFENPEIAISFTGSATVIPVPLSNNDKIIEGWQRFYIEFTVPAGATATHVSLTANNYFTRDIYFDDLRIHPRAANMVSYVYDKNTFKLKAQLDANNFATFYTYDHEGNLVNTKKETVRGIKTITEGRKELQKSGL